MANVTITSANVLYENLVRYKVKTAGVSIAKAGMPLRLDPSDNSQVLLSDASSVATAKCDGISAHPSATGQPVIFADLQNIDYGAGVFAVNETYVVSDTAGEIMPESDITSTMSTTILGIATTTSNLAAHIQESGVLEP